MQHSCTMESSISVEQDKTPAKSSDGRSPQERHLKYKTHICVHSRDRLLSCFLLVTCVHKRNGGSLILSW